MAALCDGRDVLDDTGVTLADLMGQIAGDRAVAAEWAQLGLATALRLVRGLVVVYGLSWGETAP